MRNLKPLAFFVFFFALACERIFIETHSIENRCVTGPESILFAGRVPRASFSPDNLPAGAVKGLTCELKCQSLNLHDRRLHTLRTETCVVEYLAKISACSHRLTSGKVSNLRLFASKNPFPWYVKWKQMRTALTYINDLLPQRLGVRGEPPVKRKEGVGEGRGWSWGGGCGGGGESM